jgi:lysozyme
MGLWTILFGDSRPTLDEKASALPPSGASRDADPAKPPASPAASTAGIELIKRFEGLRQAPYRDAAGHLTIGYGHLIRPGERFARAISEAEATVLLAADLREAEAAVSRLVTVPLTQGRRDALISFVFNLGAGRLAESTLLKKLNAGDGLGAAQEFVRWIHAGGTSTGSGPLKGLLRRRLAEATLFLEE